VAASNLEKKFLKVNPIMLWELSRKTEVEAVGA